MNIEMTSKRSRGGWFAVLGLSAGLAVVATAGPSAAADLFGSAAIMTNRSCPASNASCVVVTNGFADFTGPRLQQNQFFGGYGQGLSASRDLVGGASASAEVSFGADDYLPVIRLGSASGAATRTGASATSFRAFTYTGDVSIDLAIAGQLHFFTSGDAVGPFPADEFTGDGGLNVVLALLRVPTVRDAFPPGTDAISIVSNSAIDFPECGGAGVMAVGGFRSPGLTAGEYNQTVGLSQGCDGSGILINPGDSFVVVATLQAISNRGGFLDATHTFTVAYDDQDTFIAGTQQSVGDGFLRSTVVNGAAIPEPTTWALLVGGFALAGSSLRRRMASAQVLRQRA